MGGEVIIAAVRFGAATARARAPRGACLPCPPPPPPSCSVPLRPLGSCTFTRERGADERWEDLLRRGAMATPG